MSAGTIDNKRVAVLRGTVRARDGQPLGGVTIAVLGHPEFGRTLSRADGVFDLAVNGGGRLTVTYTKDGVLPAQRQVEAPWLEFAWLPDVVLVSTDPRVTAIDLSGTAPLQVARGNPVSDASGNRQATLLFPKGTSAQLLRSDGSATALSALRVHLTEYTTGPDGPSAMPAELPPTSAYTYAFELNAEEAAAPDAIEVRFDQPIPFYVENFLRFPVGTSVPLGSYDRSHGQWIASDNGLVIALLSNVGGSATLDVDGTGQPANAGVLAALGITDDERAQLAALYPAGTSLWRLSIPHFTTPWDANFGLFPPPDALPPNQPSPDSPSPPAEPPTPHCGSIIRCETQSLGEVIDITGSPIHLVYVSDRVPDRVAESTLHVQLSGASMPGSATRIDLRINVGGREIVQSFPPAADQRTTFTWDGIDAYGRPVQGRQPVSVAIGYVYRATYQPVPRFGHYGNGTIITAEPEARQEVTLWQRWRGTTGRWDSRAPGLGGWTLDVQHAYGDATGTLYLGTGEQRASRSITSVVTTTVGGGSGGTSGFSGDGGAAIEATLADPQAITAGPDGSLYIADTGNHRVRRVTSGGVISTVAGVGICCNGAGAGFGGDNGPAVLAQLNAPTGVALGPDGTLYIADTRNHRVRSVGLDGVIRTVAGNGQPGGGGDKGPASAAALSSPADVAVGRDGTLFIADTGNHRIRQVGTDGIITTVAGSVAGCSGTTGPAAQALLDTPTGVAVDREGALLLTDRCMRVRRIGSDGSIANVAGNGLQAFGGDGAPAVQASLYNPLKLASGPDGSIFIAEIGNDGGGHIRHVDPAGIITSVAGDGTACDMRSDTCGDNGPATAAGLWRPSGVALAPDGSVVVADRFNARIRRIAWPLPGFVDGLVASQDGREAYVFSGRRHVRTLDALTGAVRYQFAYDSAGRATSVTDGNGNVTTVERNVAGDATGIVSPYGQRTTLTLDTNGYLASVTNPAAETIRLASTAGGLLNMLTDPRGGVHRFSYDAQGRLARDDDPAGGSTTLSHTDTALGYTVVLSTSLGRTSAYSVERLATGGERRTHSDSSGARTVTIATPDGHRTVTAPDGTVTMLIQTPDPRWAMQAPLTGSSTVATPGGITSTTAMQRTIKLANSNNLLSLQTLRDTLVVNGQTSTSSYVAATKSITVTTPGQRQRVTTLDDRGYRVEIRVAGVAPMQVSYDSRGRVSTFGQGARIYRLSYDGRGNLATSTDPLLRTTNFAYDLAGRVVGRTLADGRVVQVAFDAGGNVTSVTPPGRLAHEFTYTSTDRVEDYVPPAVDSGANSTRASYDLDGHLAAVARPDGTTISIAYGSSGQPSTITFPSGNISLTYNPVTGLLSEITSSSTGSLTYDYDGVLPTSTIWSGAVAGRVQSTYDRNERVAGQTVNGADSVSFAYDRDGLLTQAGLLALTHDPQNGLETGSTLANVGDARSYNAFGEPETYSVSTVTGNVYAVQYTRDDIGRVTRKVETIAGVTDSYEYAYDPAGRLSGVAKNGSTVSSYEYDSNSNRVTTANEGHATTASYDAQDRLARYGLVNYTYTSNGDLKSRVAEAQTTYNYDALGNLTLATLSSGTRIEYVADGQNRRVAKKVNGTFVQGFLYQDALRPVAELDGSGDVMSRFVYAGGAAPAYLVKGGAMYRIITDDLGSPRLVLNAVTGQIVQRMDYDAFGKVTLDTNPGFQPFGFAAGLYDRDVGFTRFGARDYDPETGRWLAKDPMLFAGGDVNLYAYGFADPTNVIDPSGRGWRAVPAAIKCLFLLCTVDPIDEPPAEPPTGQSPDEGQGPASPCGGGGAGPGPDPKPGAPGPVPNPKPSPRSPVPESPTIPSPPAWLVPVIVVGGLVGTVLTAPVWVFTD